jgi:hypothetical protein
MKECPICYCEGYEVCVECGSRDMEVTMQVDRGGGLVRFRVDCNAHGGFSHMLPQSRLTRAVRRYLKEQAEQLAKATRSL